MTGFVHLVLWIVLLAAAGLFLLSKCLFLAPFRAGWLMLVANLAYEIAERKLHGSRMCMDVVLFLVSVFGFWGAAGPEAGMWAALVLGGAWIGYLRVDGHIQGGQLMRQSNALKGRVPLPVPQLVVSIQGPVLQHRQSADELGDWPEGLEQEFELRILNAGPVAAQLPLAVHVSSSTDGIEVLGSGDERPGPASGELVRVSFKLRAVRCGSGGDVLVRVRHDDFHFERILRIRSVYPKENAGGCAAEIRRWKNGASGAFVWRGDQDLYDPATFQSVEGLRVTLGLARRFRMPSSLMLSARLSLDEQEHRAFCGHFGWDRKTGEIPDFIRFLREEVDKAVEQEWPTDSEQPYAVEIGNHFYLHYGTHAAAAAENGWKSHAGIGEGPYSWMKDPSKGSFGEQRDNALKCSEVFRNALGIESASFTIPSDVWDADTARALEAAGLEVGSETDASKTAKLLRIPPPHHPAGCVRFVELTRMHPRDPENAGQLAMLKYWVGAARRTGRVFVFLAHHHLTRYKGETSLHLVEELLRHVLADQNGDLFIGSLTAVGRYWRDVLSEQTRCISIGQDGNRITIVNSGGRNLEGLPLELVDSDGRRHMRLVSVPAESSVSLEV